MDRLWIQTSWLLPLLQSIHVVFFCCLGFVFCTFRFTCLSQFPASFMDNPSVSRLGSVFLGCCCSTVCCMLSSLVVASLVASRWLSVPVAHELLNNVIKTANSDALIFELVSRQMMTCPMSSKNNFCFRNEQLRCPAAAKAQFDSQRNSTGVSQARLKFTENFR